jgi:hypothetical protein
VSFSIVRTEAAESSPDSSLREWSIGIRELVAAENQKETILTTIAEFMNISF